jgi:hypothetical protein
MEYASDEVRKRWDGLIVCPSDWESKHPQLSIRIPKERIGVPFARPGPEDVFATGTECTLWGRSAYADLAQADCATADYSALSYAFLLALYNESIP